RDAGQGRGALECGWLADRTRHGDTRRWASMWRTFRRRACDVATVWISRSTGRRWIDGREPISSSTSNDRANRAVHRAVTATISAAVAGVGRHVLVGQFQPVAEHRGLRGAGRLWEPGLR